MSASTREKPKPHSFLPPLPPQPEREEEGGRRTEIGGRTGAGVGEKKMSERETDIQTDRQTDIQRERENKRILPCIESNSVNKRARVSLTPDHL